MKTVCIFCGSKPGNSPDFSKCANEVSSLLANAGYDLVYGGGKVGLMGVIADTFLKHRRKVTGVIPRGLFDLEVGHTGLTKIHVVDSMHERKKLMYELADVFISLPGGLGTLDETFEILTWAQLGIHQKPVGLINFEGYFDELLEMLGKFEDKGFLFSKHRQLLIVDESVDGLLARFKDFRALSLPKPQERLDP